MINSSRRGFTLIELSIVLVIIGLIVGGVLVGRDMIRAAELRHVYKDYEQFSSAVHAFREKYRCIPGDCATATDFFGTMTTMSGGVCPDYASASHAAPAGITNDVKGVPTCNGDGDGKIDANATMYEMTTLWQHLGAAQLIGGIYTGGILSTPAGVAAGENFPPVSSLSGQFYWIAVDGDTSALKFALDGVESYGLVPATYGTFMGVSADVSYPFTPAEQYSFDTKFDDGSPVKGRIQMTVITGGDPAPHCTDASDETTTDAANATAQYLANDATYKNSFTCQPMFLTGW